MNELAPATALIMVLATACASLAHLLWGKHWVQLIIFWIAACAGCLLAYGLGLHLPLDLPMPSDVPVLEAVLAAWLLIIVASRLRV